MTQAGKKISTGGATQRSIRLSEVIVEGHSSQRTIRGFTAQETEIIQQDTERRNIQTAKKLLGIRNLKVRLDKMPPKTRDMTIGARNRSS